MMATKRLLTSYPDAVICGLRNGSPTAYRLGGLFVVNAQLLSGMSQRTWYCLVREVLALQTDIESLVGKLPPRGKSLV